MNPNQFVGIRSNVGQTRAPDGSQQPAYATPGSLTASIGGVFTASVASDAPTVLIVAAVLAGSLQPGDVVSGSDGTNSLPAGSTIDSQLSGTPSGVGTYQLSAGPSTGLLNSCEVISASTVLNVSAVSAGVLQPGQILADTTGDLSVGTLITGQLSGASGGVGLYSLSEQQTVAAEAMTTSMTIQAQIQALTGGDLRHVDALNLQGSHRVLYASIDIRGIVRVKLRGGDLVTLPDGSVWIVNQSLEPFYSTAGWVKTLITLQEGS